MAQGSLASGTSTTLPTGEEFRAFYERTSRAAYSLALRITADSERAGAAIEAAYIETWPSTGTDDLDGALLASVRSCALRLQPSGNANTIRSDGAIPAYTSATAIRDGLAQVDQLGRRAVELAYFGGIGVNHVAEILGQPTNLVRAAMRRALLELGSLVRDEQETRT